MLDIRTRIRTDLNPSKRIRFRIQSENIRTVFIPSCTQHMTGNPRMFTSLDEEVDGQERIIFGDNSKGKVKGLGKVAISNDHSISNY